MILWLFVVDLKKLWRCWNSLKPSQLQNVQTNSSASVLSQLFPLQLIYKAVFSLNPPQIQECVKSLIPWLLFAVWAWPQCKPEVSVCKHTAIDCLRAFTIQRDQTKGWELRQKNEMTWPLVCCIPTGKAVIQPRSLHSHTKIWPSRPHCFPTLQFIQISGYFYFTHGQKCNNRIW